MISDSRLQSIFNIWGIKGKQTTCTISGNCMYPIIKDGDSLVIDHGNNDIHVGNVVVYKKLKAFYAHRVLRIEKRDGNDTFLIKPDRGVNFDQPVLREQILGKVVKVYGQNGQIYLNSCFWKSMNYILAIKSYLSGKRYNPDSNLWKRVNAFYIICSRAFPHGYSLIPFIRKKIFCFYRYCIIKKSSK